MGNNINVWCLMAPVFAVVTFLFGTTKYRVNNRWHIVSTSKNDTMLSVVSAIFSGAIQLMVVLESLRGVVQLIIDHIVEEDLGWLPFLLAAVIITDYFIFHFLFFYSGKLGEIAIRGLLRICLKKKAEEKMEAEIKVTATQL